MGVNPYTPVPFYSRASDPTPNDSQNFILGTIWLNTLSETIWFLVNLDGGVATWVQLSAGGGGTVISLMGNSGGAVMPTSGNINVLGDGLGIVITGNPGTSTLTASLVGGGIAGQSFVTSSGTALPNGAGVLNVLGGTGISTVGAGNTVAIAITGAVATSYDGNSGTATPSAGVLNIVGDGSTALTAASGNTITITAIGGGGGGGSVLDVIGGNNITITGTSTIDPIVNVSGTTNHCVQIGNASGSLTSVANGTTGQVLTAQTGADPIWTTGGGGSGTSSSLIGSSSQSGLLAGAGTQFASFYSGSNATSANVEYSMPVAGIINNLYVNIGTSTSSIDATVTLYKNGSPTSLTTTLPTATTGVFTDLSHSVSVVQGDQVQWVITSAGTGFCRGGISAQFSTSSGAPASGALVLIQTKTASGVAELDFTTGITSTYNNYMLQLSNIVWSNSSASVTLGIQISTNGGSTYISTGYQKGNASSTATNIEITEFGVGGNTIFTNAKVELSNLTSGSGYVMGTPGDSLSFVPATGSTPGSGFGGVYTASSSIIVNAVRVVVSDGSNFSGTGSLYGYAM